MTKYLGDGSTSNLADVEDITRVKQYLGYMVGAAKRHKKFAALVSMATFALVVVALLLMNPTFRVETRVLTQESFLIPALVSSSRAGSMKARGTRHAVELINSRENLSGIITEANLLERWPETRGMVRGVKDSIVQGITGMTEEDLREVILFTLAKKLTPYIEGDVVIIRIEWHDKFDAVQIAEVAKRRFLRSRKEAELGEVNETVGILSEKVEESRIQVEDVTAEVSTFIDKRTGKPTRRAPKTKKSSGKNALSPKNEMRMNRLKNQLAETVSAIDRLQSAYDSKKRKAEQTLATLTRTYGPQHPEYRSAVRTVEESARPPRQLSFLKQERVQIENSMKKLNPDGRRGAAKDIYDIVHLPKNVQAAAENATVNMEHPEVAGRFRQLSSTIEAHNMLVDRLAQARIEVEVAERAFDYRYIVTVPPRIPNKKIKPKPAIILGGGFVLALLLGLLASVLRDFLSRRVYEPWQVEMATGVPVLGSVPGKTLRGR